MADSTEEIKGFLVKVKEESEKKKNGLKLDIQKTKNMTFSSITSWQIERKKVEAVVDFFSLWASKSLQIMTIAMKLKDTCFLKEKL